MPRQRARGVRARQGRASVGSRRPRFVDWGMGINNVLDRPRGGPHRRHGACEPSPGQTFPRPTLREVEAAEQLLALFPRHRDGEVRQERLGRQIRRHCGWRARSPDVRVLFDGCGAVSGDPRLVHRHTPRSTPACRKRRPALTQPFAFNDLRSIEHLFGEHRGNWRAVILEPVASHGPRAGFLEGLRACATSTARCSIFDEIVTGFRYRLHGAHTAVWGDAGSDGNGQGDGERLLGRALAGRRGHPRGGLDHSDPRCFCCRRPTAPSSRDSPRQ